MTSPIDTNLLHVKPVASHPTPKFNKKRKMLTSTCIKQKIDFDDHLFVDFTDQITDEIFTSYKRLMTIKRKFHALQLSKFEVSEDKEKTHRGFEINSDQKLAIQYAYSTITHCKKYVEQVAKEIQLLEIGLEYIDRHSDKDCLEDTYSLVCEGDNIPNFYKRPKT